MPGVHHKFSASTSERWMACPGSVAACKDLPEQTTSYAAEGTEAHEMAAKKLQGVYVGVNEEMNECTDTYVDFIKELREDQDTLLVEKEVIVEPVLDCGGTLDCGLIQPQSKCLRVIDLKYGKGVPVNAKGNSQLRIYAYGLLNLCKEQKILIDEIRCYIFQPRANVSNPISAEKLTTSELRKWVTEKLYPALAQARNADAPKNPGPHCRWCRAAGECSAARKIVEERAMQDLGAATTGKAQLPLPTQLTPEQMGKVLDFADMLNQWIKAVEGAALARLKSGLPVLGYKLVRKGTHRKWRDETAAETMLKTLIGDEAFKKDLISPTQAENLLKKKGQSPDNLKDQIYKPEGELTVAPESDERQEVNPQQAAVKALENDDSYLK